MMMSVSIVVLWDLTPWSAADMFKWFGETWCACDVSSRKRVPKS